MSRFIHRSNQKELMDLSVHKEWEIRQNLKEIAWINAVTGGGLQYLQFVSDLIHNAGPRVALLDIGFGAGDFLNRLAHQFAPSKLTLYGIDLMPEALTAAYNQYPILQNRAHLIQAHYSDTLNEERVYDFITANLFCHHLEQDELVLFLKKAVKKAGNRVIINDLSRHPVAYYGIAFLTRLFSKSRYTRHDAPLSVLRGFTITEWKQILSAAGIDDYEIKPIWSFRHRISIQGKALSQ